MDSVWMCWVSTLTSGNNQAGLRCSQNANGVAMKQGMSSELCLTCGVAPAQVRVPAQHGHELMQVSVCQRASQLHDALFQVRGTREQQRGRLNFLRAAQQRRRAQR